MSRAARDFLFSDNVAIELAAVLVFMILPLATGTVVVRWMLGRWFARPNGGVPRHALWPTALIVSLLLSPFYGILENIFALFTRYGMVSGGNFLGLIVIMLLLTMPTLLVFGPLLL
ncbi:MAG: hypothetical protein HC829_02625 [Bacteroidales bacterium]|nr:hypothetical protein [Bacteroidales bacterium]